MKPEIANLIQRLTKHSFFAEENISNIFREAKTALKEAYKPVDDEELAERIRQIRTLSDDAADLIERLARTNKMLVRIEISQQAEIGQLKEMRQAAEQSVMEHAEKCREQQAEIEKYKRLLNMSGQNAQLRLMDAEAKIALLKSEIQGLHEDAAKPEDNNET